jgi:hypothetical protein
MNLIFTFFVSLLGLFAGPLTSVAYSTDPKATGICRSEGVITWKTEYADNRVLIESGIAIYSGKNNGITHERIVFRYTNRSAENIQLSFGRKMIYNGVCSGCDKAEKRFVVALGPGETKEYSEQNRDKTYYIFSKDLKQLIKPTLDSFEITNIVTLVQ